MSFTKQLILAGVLCLVLVLLVASCHRDAQRLGQAESWGQGYDSPQTGLYMQPDHGYWYYYMLSHMWMSPTPTYHIYVPPAGYPNSYRPWHQMVYTAVPTFTASPTAGVPPRTSGGFSTSDRPSPSTSTPGASPRTSGGFSRPPVPKFEQPAQSYPSAPRTSGGFSSSRPSGGSSPRSSGGFSSSSSGRRR